MAVIVTVQFTLEDAEFEGWENNPEELKLSVAARLNEIDDDLGSVAVPQQVDVYVRHIPGL